MNTSVTPALVIIDDDNILKEYLKNIFESIQIRVETFENPLSFLKQNEQMNIGCIITDVRMPGMSGLELLELLKSQNNRLPIFVMTGHGDVQMAIRAMKAGAIDFLLKPLNEQFILAKVQKYMNQKTKTYSQEPLKTLTKREFQIIDLIANGKLNKQMAYELNLSISTIETLRAQIMKKVKAKNVAELLKIYYYSDNRELKQHM